MAPARRYRGLGIWLFSGLLVGLSLAVLSVLILTQTRWGHEQVLSLTLRLAAGQFDGELTIERLEGNLLVGARLHGIALRGPEGDPLLLADSAFLEYNLRTVAGAEIVFNRLQLFDPELYLRRLPGEEYWNYQRILGDTLPPDPEVVGSPTIFQRLTVVNGFVLLEMPWEPDEELTPAEQRREIQEALADTSRIIVREVPGGYLRTMRFAGLQADASPVVTAPDVLGGTYLQIDRLAGEIQIFREPALVEHAVGEMALREGVLEFQLPVLRLPDSQLAAFGVIDTGGEDGVRLDITLAAETAAFRDFQWLHPPLPDEGGGQLVLTIQSRPEGTLYFARELQIRAPGTELRGQFGLILNDDVLRFVEVDLAASPLDVATIERILPVDIPVVGLRIGGLEIRGPTT